MLHDYVCKTWFHGILADYALRRKLRKLQIKEFGTAGSGKTRLNRTMVVSLRSTLQSLRSLEEPADMERLKEVLEKIDLAGVVTELLSESNHCMAEKISLMEKKWHVYGSGSCTSVRALKSV